MKNILMKTELNIPIYRANKIDSDECVEGCITYGSGKTLFISNTGMSNWCRIDPSTLEISFDGGENFNSFIFVNACIEQTAIRDSRSCGNCLYYNENNECEVTNKDMGEEHYCSLWKEIRR